MQRSSASKLVIQFIGASTAVAVTLGGVFAYVVHDVGKERMQHHWDMATKAKGGDAREPSDALVVFPGNHGRIEAALLSAQPGQKVMISGGDPKNTVDKLLEKLDIDLADLKIPKGDIILLSNALNTQGNALETAWWLVRNPDVKSMTVFTSEQHVPRAHMELMRVLPHDIQVRFHPVKSGGRDTRLDETLKMGCRTIPFCGMIREQLTPWPIKPPLREPYALKFNFGFNGLEAPTR